MMNNLSNPVTGIKISIVAIAISIVVLGLQYMNDGSVWLGVILILSNTTILLSNIAKVKASRSDKREEDDKFIE